MTDLRRSRWAFVQTFKPRTKRATARWATLDPFLQAARAFWEAARARVDRALEPWDRKLVALGGDPSRTEWARFRPLRLSREEDWSDWLAELLESSTTGALARVFDAEGQRAHGVRRETATGRFEESSYRLDLIVEWAPGKHTHIEVKVGDLNLAKTWDTAKAIELREGGAWSHFLLVPPDHEADAEQAAEQHNSERLRIEVVTWRQVAQALRVSLWDQKESTTWLAFARAFTGAIEQRLLGIDPTMLDGYRQRAGAAQLLSLLEGVVDAER